MTTITSDSQLPSFKKPPVTEVVCSILFKTLDKFFIPHFGDLWRRFPDYTRCEEAPPLLPVVERFDALPPTDVQSPTEVPLPRVWFHHRNENALIQVQRDRFLHNWKKVTPADEYPRYHWVKNLYQEHLVTFENFLSELQLGTIVPRQYEMTYVNHIPQGEGWETLSDLAKVFPDFAWQLRDGRFLSVPQGRNLQFYFPIPDKSGRLHVSIRTGERRLDRRPLVLFELTVRGIASDTSREAMWKWFDFAREWIVRGFADLTGDEIQQGVWGRMR